MKERLGAGKANDTTARAATAREITKRPGAYKLCLGCESILTAGLLVCPLCHAYRFDLDAETIRRRAAVLGRKN